MDPTGATSRPPSASWRSSAYGSASRRRGHVDRLERRLARQAVPPVPDHERDVVDPEVADRLLGDGAQLAVALDRVHVRGEQRQQRGVVSGTGPDVEHAVGRLEAQGLEHASDDERLGDRLATADREGHVLVGAPAQVRRDEPLARNARDRSEHALVADRRSQQAR